MEDDYSNIERVCERIGLKERDCRAIKKAKGLRNVLVHEYKGIIDELAYDSIKEVLPAIKMFKEGLVKWVEKGFLKR